MLSFLFSLIFIAFLLETCMYKSFIAFRFSSTYSFLWRTEFLWLPILLVVTLLAWRGSVLSFISISYHVSLLPHIFLFLAKIAGYNLEGYFNLYLNLPNLKKGLINKNFVRKNSVPYWCTLLIPQTCSLGNSY